MLWATLHFSIILLHNVVSSMSGYRAVYGFDKQAGIVKNTLQHGRQLTMAAPVRLYAYYSGTEAGYGFFAPQVGSQYIPLFDLYDHEGRSMGRYSGPSLRREESLRRYSGFLDIFQGLLSPSPEADSLQLRYARAVLHSLGERLGKKRGASRVECQIGVYRDRSLRRKVESKPAGLLPLYTKSITIKTCL